jgi:hypothetical protein
MRYHRVSRVSDDSGVAGKREAGKSRRGQLFLRGRRGEMRDPCEMRRDTAVNVDDRHEIRRLCYDDAHCILDRIPVGM